MDAIRIKNLRSLQDTQQIELRAINLLVGENSSGKSTFLRFFPLIKQSVITDTVGPISWYGSLVDFGSFHEAIRRDSDSKLITFEFFYRIETSQSRKAYKPNIVSIREEPFDVAIELSIEQPEKQENTRLSRVVLLYLGNRVEIKFTAKHENAKLLINSKDVTHLFLFSDFVQQSSLLPPSRVFSGRRLLDQEQSRVSEKLITTLKSISRSKSDETIKHILKKLILGTKDDLLQSIRSIQSTASWMNTVSAFDVDHPEFVELYELVIAESMPEVYATAELFIRSMAENVSYIAPLRASVERYYRIQELAVREVDSQGKNLPMYFRSLPRKRQEQFNQWLRENLKFELETSLLEGHLSLKLKNAINNDTYNLADMGFGFSQVMPILVQLWSISNRKNRLSIHRRRMKAESIPMIFAIEQPELHLHPRLQAVLCDIFMRTVDIAEDLGVNLKLILETHSETIINRFGNKITHGEFRHENINVILFEKAFDGTVTTITQTPYDKHGYLTRWPYGFFEPTD